MNEIELDVEMTIWVKVWVPEDATQTEIRNELRSTHNWHDWDIMDITKAEPTGEVEHA